eukprot:814771_1
MALSHPMTPSNIDMLPPPLVSTSSCSSTSTPVRRRPRARSRAESITADSTDAKHFFGRMTPPTPLTQVMKTPPSTPSIRDVMSLPTLNLDEVDPKDVNDPVTDEPEAFVQSMPELELKVNALNEKSLKASPTTQCVPEDIKDTRCQCNIM